MPVRRVLGVLFRFDIAIIIYAIVDLIIGKGRFPYSAKTFLLSLIGWESIGNSNWYIFAILIAYIATYIAFKLLKDKGNYKWSVILTLALILAYCAIMRYAKLKNVTIWYDTILCYPLGMLFSLYKVKIEAVLERKKYIYYLIILFAFPLQLLNYKFGYNFFLRELAMLSFAVLIVFLSMKVAFNNKYLEWCGKHLFGIYILQRLPMMVFKEIGLASFNIYLYLMVCLAVTLCIAWLFEKYIGILWKKIADKTQEISYD